MTYTEFQNIVNNKFGRFNEKGFDARLGNFIQLIQTIPDNSIDCIVTDPPYATISGGTPDNPYVNRPSGILAKNDGKIFQENDIPITAWINDLYRVLKDNTHIYIMTNLLNLSSYLIEIEKAGFAIHNLLIWKKNNVTPSRWYMKNCEYIIFARKGSAKPINDCGTKTVLEVNNVKDKIHPTEKPIELLSILINNSTQPGDIVFDPFAGSNSTTLAAIKNGRLALSFELDEEYYNSGLARLEEFDINDTTIIPIKKNALTPNQLIILKVLQDNPDQEFSGQMLSELTGLAPRTCSGCITPLCANGLAYKTNSKSPFKIRLKI